MNKSLHYEVIKNITSDFLGSLFFLASDGEKCELTEPCFLVMDLESKWINKTKQNTNSKPRQNGIKRQ